jgi:hypothetical protein
MCASVFSSCNVDICTGSWTLRSKISLEAGECSLGELDLNLEGDAAAAMDGYGWREGGMGTGCGCEG